MDIDDLIPVVEVTFKVMCNTSFGTSLWLSGSVSRLGNWSTKNAVRLQANNYTYEYPIWESESLSLPRGVPVEYKFFKKSSEGKVVWEKLEGETNHSITLDYEDQIEITSAFDSLQQQVEIITEEANYEDPQVHVADSDIVLFVTYLLPFILHKGKGKFSFVKSRVSISLSNSVYCIRHYSTC
eukprot:TRINITY_DN3188_c0_g1_i12.p1 TRINITY_DN3188_c0_g1~~TRINITY_DN3188_c0_g1_i12.p1  ORF type:complete len:183 (+),score=31.74 TRINITY_DN3188_c0_g1_i12:572-1120(+)